MSGFWGILQVDKVFEIGDFALPGAYRILALIRNMRIYILFTINFLRNTPS